MSAEIVLVSGVTGQESDRSFWVGNFRLLKVETTAETKTLETKLEKIKIKISNKRYLVTFEPLIYISGETDFVFNCYKLLRRTEGQDEFEVVAVSYNISDSYMSDKTFELSDDTKNINYEYAVVAEMNVVVTN